MLKELLEILKKNYKKYKNRYGINSCFFEIEKEYKVTENFNSLNSYFIKDEKLICKGNFLAWYDGVFVITFESIKGDVKHIFIQECYLDNGSNRPRSASDLEAELQSYEKYFERLT